MFQIHPIIKKKHNPQKNSYIKLHWQYWAAPFFCDPMCTINKDLFLPGPPPTPATPTTSHPPKSLAWLGPPYILGLGSDALGNFHLQSPWVWIFCRARVGWSFPYPKNHGISKLVVWRSQTPAIHIQTPLLQGPVILWLQHISHMIWSHWLDLIFTFHHPTPSWGLADPYN